MTLRVLLVDDQELVRAGLRMLLRGEADVEVIGEAGEGVGAVATCQRLRPDVVLMDIRMPGLDGVGATRELLAGAADAAPAVIMLTTFADDDAVRAAIRAGARGYLLKHTGSAELVAAIRRVAAGKAWLDPQGYGGRSGRRQAGPAAPGIRGHSRSDPT